MSRYKKIDPEIKEEWCQNLESGKFKQGKSALRTVYVSKQTEHCCLGVLCEIRPEVEFVGQSVARMVDGGNSSTIWLPLEFRRKIGMTEDVQRRLSEMNDGLKDGGGPLKGGPKSFKEIAAWIRKTL